ncbi:MAG: rhomboid family intramembrane serine protease [Chloroflexi bacterium]|nr:rhomboid family intramembrane serine protease [Chloroflexota bacterium]
MLLPVQVESRLARLPRATLTLVALNLAIYLLLALQAAGQNHSFLQDFVFLPSSIVQQWGLLPNQVSAAAFLTSSWIHLDILHLLGNVLFLWVFGAAAEESLGWTAVTVVYLLGGLFAAITQYAASRAGIAPVPAWTVLLAFVVWYGLAPVITGERGGVSGYWGHLGGALAGLTLSLALRFAPQGGIDYDMEDAIKRINNGDLKVGLDTLHSLRRSAPADPRVPLALARSYARVWDSKSAGKHFGEAVQIELAHHRCQAARQIWDEASHAGALLHPRLALNLAAALEVEGDSVPARQLYEWAAAGPDEAAASVARQRLTRAG